MYVLLCIPALEQSFPRRNVIIKKTTDEAAQLTRKSSHYSAGSIVAGHNKLSSQHLRPPQARNPLFFTPFLTGPN